MTERGGMDRRTFLKVMGFSFGTATVGATLPTPASGAPAVEAAKGSELVAAPESKEYVNYRKTLKSLSNSASREILLDSLNSESEQSQDSTREFNQLAENILGAWAEELAGKDADENVVEGFKRRYKESGVINLWREMCMGLSDTEKIDRKAITKCLVENVRMSYIAMEVARDNYEKWQFPQSNDLSGALDTPGAVDFRRIVKKKRPATDPTMEAGEQIETFLDLGDDRDLDTQGQVFVAPRSIIADVALGERSLSSDQRKILLETLKPLDGYAYGIGRMQDLLLKNGILKVEEGDSVKDLGEYVVKQMQRSEPVYVKELESGFYEQADKEKSSPLIEAVYSKIKDIDPSHSKEIARQVSDEIERFLNAKNDKFSLSDDDEQRVANGLQVYLDSISEPLVEDNAITLEGAEKLVAMARGFVDVAFDMDKVQGFSPVGPNWPMENEEVLWDKVDWSRVTIDDEKQQSFYAKWPNPNFEDRYMKSLMPLRAFMANAMTNSEKFEETWNKLNYDSQQVIRESLVNVQIETSKLPEIFSLNDEGTLSNEIDGIIGQVHVDGTRGKEDQRPTDRYRELTKVESEWATWVDNN